MKFSLQSSAYGDPISHRYLGERTMEVVAKWSEIAKNGGPEVKTALRLIGSYSEETKDVMERSFTDAKDLEALIEISLQFLSEICPANYIHTMRVTMLSLFLAEETERSPEDKAKLCMAALLHDAGKLATPEELLRRWMRLSDTEFSQLHNRITQSPALDTSERKLADSALQNFRNGQVPNIWELVTLARWEATALQPQSLVSQLFRNLYSVTSGKDGIVQNHVFHSEYFIRLLPPSKNSAFINEVAGIAGSHHEALNGTGFPRQLANEAIHPLAHILMVADKFEAATSNWGNGNGGNIENGVTDLQKLVESGVLSRGVVEAGKNGAFERFLNNSPTRIEDLRPVMQPQPISSWALTS